jgi:hypothetical protein
MNEIGKYGHEKYAENSFHAKAQRGDFTRGDSERTQPDEIAKHAAEHFNMYLRGELHDHFGTRGAQLAAVGFNAMMEFYFYTQEQSRISDLK